MFVLFFVLSLCLVVLPSTVITFWGRGICPVSILYKSIEGRYQPVRVADGPITARYRFIKNAFWVVALLFFVCALSVTIYLCFLLVSLEGYDKWLWLFWHIFNTIFPYNKYQLGTETSLYSNNYKPKPFSETKRKRKQTKPNKRKPNKRKKSIKISSLFPKRGNRNAKRTEKHKNKITQGKTYKTNRLVEP